MVIIEVNKNNLNLIQSFLDGAGNSLNSFRYFNKREISIVLKHVCTYLVRIEDQFVGYCHLEEYDGKIWLGIAVSEFYIGQGIGTLMMKHLMNFAIVKKVSEIYLSVDRENVSAQSLYKRFDFKRTHNKGDVCFFKKVFNE
jgi:ribosomal protein S18 acetylase RimI-like enzyme